MAHSKLHSLGSTEDHTSTTLAELNNLISGTTDGIFLDIHYSNSPAYIEDMNIKVWATTNIGLTV